MGIVETNSTSYVPETPPGKAGVSLTRVSWGSYPLEHAENPNKTLIEVESPHRTLVTSQEERFERGLAAASSPPAFCGPEVIHA